MRNNTRNKWLGDAAESLFIAQCRMRGVRVAVPIGDASPFDVVICGDVMRRVQVKAIGIRKCRSYSVRVTSGGRKNEKTFDEQDIDMLAVWHVRTNDWYLVPVSELRDRKYISPRSMIAYKNNWELIQ